MSALSYTPAVANQKPAAIARVYIRTGSEKWQSLGEIRDAEFHGPAQTGPNSLGQNRAHSVDLNCVFKMKQTSSVEILLLDSICNGANDFLLQMVDADTSGYTDGFVYMPSTMVAAFGKLVSTGDSGQDRYIDMTIGGNIPKTSLTSVLKPTVAGSDFQAAATSGGTFALIGSGGSTGAWTNVNLGHVDHIIGASATSIQIQNDLDTGYTTLGKITNFHLEAGFVSEGDSIKRPQTYGADILLEYDHLESQVVGNLDQQAAWLDMQIAVKATLLDAQVITLSEKLGFESSYEVVGNFDKFRVVHNKHVGRIAKGSFDGLWS